MEKLVTLKLGAGSLATGFAVVLQIGDGQGWPGVEIAGHLPPAEALQHTYQRWQAAYRRLGMPYRLGVSKAGFATNVSRLQDCREVAQQLSQQFNQWLRADSFRPLQEKLLEKLDASMPVRLVVQTQQTVVQRLPWPSWEMCDRYPKLEIALSAPSFEQGPRPSSVRSQVRILAVLGHSAGVDVVTDQALLNRLPNAEVVVLPQPDRPSLNAHLWDPAGWDILFFAGHSYSQSISDTEITGQLQINPDKSLTIPELKHALRKAQARGLQVAMFNSCDGLGLAQSLAELSIPQVLVMREPVPDRVAHEFLKSFLEAFSRGEPLYLAVREAREKLHGLEGQFPGATWLPVIFQNPAAVPPAWSDLHSLPAAAPARPRRRRRPALLAAVLVGVATLAMRQLGLLQSWELKALDLFMGWRPLEAPDERLVVVTVGEADVQRQDPAQRRGSLSDQALAALLAKLEPMQPRLIGLDIYRDFPATASQPRLARQLATADNLIAVCKVSTDDTSGIAPPPEVAAPQVGFSDFVVDADQRVRRQLLALTPDPASRCRASYGFGVLLALNYLAEAGKTVQATPSGALQVESIVFEPIEASFGGYQGIDAGGHQVMLNYRSLKDPKRIAEQVTLSDVLDDRVDPEAIRDRIVLIGTTAASFGDFWAIPQPLRGPDGEELAGVFMQAQMTSQILSAVLDERPLIRAWPNGLEAGWILLWVGVGGAIAVGIGAAPGRTGLGLLLAGGAELLLLGVSWQLLVQWGYWVPWLPGAIALPITVGIGVALLSRPLPPSDESKPYR